MDMHAQGKLLHGQKTVKMRAEGNEWLRLLELHSDQFEVGKCPMYFKIT